MVLLLTPLTSPGLGLLWGVCTLIRAPGPPMGCGGRSIDPALALRAACLVPLSRLLCLPSGPSKSSPGSSEGLCVALPNP